MEENQWRIVGESVEKIKGNGTAEPSGSPSPPSATHSTNSAVEKKSGVDKGVWQWRERILTRIEGGEIIDEDDEKQHGSRHCSVSNA